MAIAPDTTNPPSVLDFNDLENELLNVRQMVELLHTYLLRMPCAPEQLFARPMGNDRRVLNEHDMTQLTFMVCQSLNFIDATSDQMDKLIAKLAPPKLKAA
jgi:hypothetical protein